MVEGKGARRVGIRHKTSGRNKISRVVVVNSHSDNRGDEAAQRSMVKAILSIRPDIQIVILTKSPHGLDIQNGVIVKKTFSISIRSVLPLVLWMFLHFTKLRSPGSQGAKSVVFDALDELASATVVLSAPGGPYFGELYPAHEMEEHIFHLLLARMLGKPVMVYASSMGPFRSHWRNLVRRLVLEQVSIITVRDSISKKYLSNLGLHHPLQYLASDSVFQWRYPFPSTYAMKLLRDARIVPSMAKDPRPLIGFTVAGRFWNSRGKNLTIKHQNDYNAEIAYCIDCAITRFHGRVLLLPQLYGASEDVSLLMGIKAMCKYNRFVSILPEDCDSDMQQAIISQLEFVVGNRYHSVVFALANSIPAICLAYEHKSVGLMQLFSMDRYVLKVEAFTPERLIALMEEVWSERSSIAEHLAVALRDVRAKSWLSSLLAVSLLECAEGNSLTRADLRWQLEQNLRCCELLDRVHDKG